MRVQRLRNYLVALPFASSGLPGDRISHNGSNLDSCRSAAGGGWWYIENTTAGRDECWVWGEIRVVTGDTESLPYITPPPTTTPLPIWTGMWST